MMGIAIRDLLASASSDNHPASRPRVRSEYMTKFGPRQSVEAVDPVVCVRDAAEMAEVEGRAWERVKQARTERMRLWRKIIQLTWDAEDVDMKLDFEEMTREANEDHAAGVEDDVEDEPTPAEYQANIDRAETAVGLLHDLFMQRTGCAVALLSAFNCSGVSTAPGPDGRSRASSWGHFSKNSSAIRSQKRVSDFIFELACARLFRVSPCVRGHVRGIVWSNLTWVMGPNRPVGEHQKTGNGILVFHSVSYYHSSGVVVPVHEENSDDANDGNCDIKAHVSELTEA
ncbi:hypothetical protein B0H13DRAFT_2523337 [Mycena leptocephala]|nr:hypothetical protein B0H13DRAFT_2523337 [Mycena leptocephala]